MCVFTELFQLVAVHLPQSGDQLVEAREFSAVLSDVSSNPAAIAFGRGVRSPTPLSLTARVTQLSHVDLKAPDVIKLDVASL